MLDRDCLQELRHGIRHVQARLLKHCGARNIDQVVGKGSLREAVVVRQGEVVALQLWRQDALEAVDVSQELLALSRDEGEIPTMPPIDFAVHHTKSTEVALHLICTIDACPGELLQPLR